jgi:CBS domain-containing membrane protein
MTMKRMFRKPIRDDVINALKDVDSFIDVTVDDLMDIYSRAEKYASRRTTGHLKVSDLMSQPVTTVHHARSLAEAAHLLVSSRISGLPVVDDDNKMIGIITEADFLRALGVPSSHPTHSVWQTLEAMFSHDTTIKDPTEQITELMIRNVVTVAPDKTLHDVISLMKKHKIKRVVVCDDHRHVLGMVTRSDLVRIFFDQFASAPGKERLQFSP